MELPDILFSSLVQRLTRSAKRNPEGRSRRSSSGRNGSLRLSLETLEHRNMLSAGTPNPHFGTGGTALVNFGDFTLLGSPTFAVDPNGMTVVAGNVQDPNTGRLGTGVAELTKDG